MANEKVSYDCLPECVKTGFIDSIDLADSLWENRLIPYDNIEINYMQLEDDEESQYILSLKEDYLQKRKVCPLTIEMIGGLLFPVAGFHRLNAYRRAVEEDNTLPKSIECWVRIDMV